MFTHKWKVDMACNFNYFIETGVLLKVTGCRIKVVIYRKWCKI